MRSEEMILVVNMPDCFYMSWLLGALATVIHQRAAYHKLLDFINNVFV